MSLWAFLLGRTPTATTTATTHNIDIPIAHTFTHIYIYIFIYESSVTFFWEFLLFRWHSVVRGDLPTNGHTTYSSFIPWPVSTSINGRQWTMTQRSSDIVMMIIFSLSLSGITRGGWWCTHSLLATTIVFFWTLHFIWPPPIDIRCRSFSDLSVTTMIAYYFMIWWATHTTCVFFVCRFHTWTVVKDAMISSHMTNHSWCLIHDSWQRVANPHESLPAIIHTFYCKEWKYRYLLEEHTALHRFCFTHITKKQTL